MLQDIQRIEDIVKHAEAVLDIDLGDVLKELAAAKEKAAKIEALTLNSDNGLAVMINRILGVQPGVKKEPGIIIRIVHIKYRPPGKIARTFKVAKTEEERLEYLAELKKLHPAAEVWEEPKVKTNIKLN